MSENSQLDKSRRIAEEIIERSPSIALRVTGSIGREETLFITKNISAYGYSRDDFMSGRVSWLDLIHPDDLDDLVNLLNSFDEMLNDQFTIVYRIVKADGTPVWVIDNTLVARDGDGVAVYSDCIISDYTETKENIERIGENFRQQSVMNEILQGIHDADLDKALQIILYKSGSYLDVSRVVLFEYSEDGESMRAAYEWRNVNIPSLLDQGEYRINHKEEAPEVFEELSRHGRCIVHHGEIPRKTMDVFSREGVIASAIFAIAVNGEPFGCICFDECVRPRHWGQEIVRFLDNISRLVAPVIVRRRSEAIIRSMALTDQLTGLSNRNSLEIRLKGSIADAVDKGYVNHLLLIDMDDFKIINDAYGHDYGDVILREVSAFLSEHFRDARNVFRFGGDEFVILLEHSRSEDVKSLIERLLARAQLPWNVLDRTFYCTLSIGVVRFPEGREDAREILKNADIAMYQAKKMGKNNYIFYSSTLDNDSVARAEIETAMRESIDGGFSGFEVNYQPLTDLDGRIIGAEALLRWTLPDGQRLSPTHFIPLAEYLGLIIPIGEFVIGDASALCRKINAVRPDFFVSINVSIRQFRQNDFVERTLAIMETTGVDLTSVALEITEGMAIQDLQRMKSLAGELRRRGIRIAMDDFGIGYSSLGNMRELPIDVVKIDRSFIHDVTTDAYSKSFIRFIADLVHSMGRKVCIEGVETEEQLAYCRECGADYVQGFHMWKPMPGEAMLDVMSL